MQEVERQELRAMIAREHWQKLNAIVRFVLETGMETSAEDGEMEVFRRWTKLKSDYEAGDWPGVISIGLHQTAD